MAAAIAAGRQLDREIQMAEREQKSAKKKERAWYLDDEGNKVMLTEENQGDEKHVERKNTKVSEESVEEAVCKICWGTEKEDLAANVDGEDQEPNPLISPCKCMGT